MLQVRTQRKPSGKAVQGEFQGCQCSKAGNHPTSLVESASPPGDGAEPYIEGRKWCCQYFTGGRRFFQRSFVQRLEVIFHDQKRVTHVSRITIKGRLIFHGYVRLEFSVDKSPGMRDKYELCAASLLRYAKLS